jgi:hypothetical protein
LFQVHGPPHGRSGDGNVPSMGERHFAILPQVIPQMRLPVYSS